MCSFRYTIKHISKHVRILYYYFLQIARETINILLYIIIYFNRQKYNHEILVCYYLEIIFAILLLYSICVYFYAVSACTRAILFQFHISNILLYYIPNYWGIHRGFRLHYNRQYNIGCADSL